MYLQISKATSAHTISLQAKDLHLRAIEIDENPIAMLNLALLLKCDGRKSQNIAEADGLFFKVANLDTG